MLPLNFNHFYYFYEVARHGSFTAASRELMVAQSSLSIQVANLEQSMGRRLFDRRRSGVELTEAGREAYEVAERVFHDLDRLHASLQESERRLRGRVSIGTVDSIGIYMLPRLLTGFRETWPDVGVKIDFKPGEAAVGLLQSDRVDFTIVPWERRYPGLTGVRLSRQKMFLVAPPGHPLSGRSDVAPRDLESFPFVGYEEGMHTRSMLDALFKRLALSIEYAIESANSATIKHMVIAGMGLAVLPEVVVGVELRQGQLVRVDVKAFVMSRDVVLYHKTARRLSPARAAFAEYVRKALAPRTVRRHP